MKKLQRFQDLKMSQEETETINGGAPATASGTINGSAWTFSGDVGPTCVGTKTIAAGVWVTTDNVYTRDYNGVGTLDGVSGPVHTP